MNSTVSVRALIRDAAYDGVTLWVEKGQLCYKASKGRIPETLRAALQSNRADVIGELSRPVFRKSGSTPRLLRYPSFWRDFWEETQANLSLSHATHFAIRLTGDLSLEQIVRALRRLATRYDLLRSRVMLEEGIPSLVLDEHQRSIDVIDLSVSAAADRAEQLKCLAAQAIYAPLEDGAIYRVRIIKASEKEYLVAAVLHHFVGDPISCGILARELLVWLQDEPESEPSTTRPLQYSD